MYISPRVLEGGRRHRLVVGTMLLLLWLVLGIGMTATAVGNSSVGWLARLGLGAGAVSAWLLVWWCARYWYAAFREGRRPEPVPVPSPWPWLVPWILMIVALVVTGVRGLARGDDGAWFSLGFAGLLALPALGGLVMVLYDMLSSPRRSSRSAAPGPGSGPEPPRPRRDWGPIGRG